jgi:hypothetical protein
LLKNKRKVSLPFAVPMVWRESTNHVNDCYFCIAQTEGLKGKDKKIKYPNILSAVRPVSHSDELPVSLPPQTWSLEEKNTDDPMETVHTSSESEYEDPNKPHLIAKSELNDLVRD